MMVHVVLLGQTACQQCGRQHSGKLAMKATPIGWVNVPSIQRAELTQQGSCISMVPNEADQAPSTPPQHVVEG